MKFSLVHHHSIVSSLYWLIMLSVLANTWNSRGMAQDPAPLKEPAPPSEPVPAKSPTGENNPSPSDATKQEGVVEKEDSADLDIFDDFFGKKPTKDEAAAKPKAATDEKEAPAQAEKADVAVEIMVAPAVVAPAMRLAPAARAGVAIAIEMPEDDAGAENAEDVDLDPRINRLSRALQLERALLRRACELTPEQDKTLEAWDGKWIQTLLQTDVGKKASRRLSVIPMGLPDVPFSQCRSVLQDLISSELQKTLTEVQYAAYKAEVDARIAFEKQTQIDATVAILDHHLMLDSTQRDEVEKVVIKMANLPQEPLNYLRYGQYIPNMSFTPVLKHLNKYQRKILQGLQQVTFGSSNEEQVDIIER